MTTPLRETFTQEVPEGGSCRIGGYLEDETGAQIPLAGVMTAVLWLDDQETGATINSRSNSNIKNANGGTIAEVTENGTNRTKLTLALGPADNPVVNSAKVNEWHAGLIRIVYNGGAGVMEKPFEVKVVNLSHVP